MPMVRTSRLNQGKESAPLSLVTLATHSLYPSLPQIAAVQDPTHLPPHSPCNTSVCPANRLSKELKVSFGRHVGVNQRSKNIQQKRMVMWVNITKFSLINSEMRTMKTKHCIFQETKYARFQGLSLYQSGSQQEKDGIFE